MTDEWMSAQLRHATAQFNAAAREAAETCQDASTTARNLTTTSGDMSGTTAYRRLEQQAGTYFRTGGAGHGARQLQERVDRGEFTWRQIWSGTADPEAVELYRQNQAAILSGVEEARRLDTASPEQERHDEDPDDDGPLFRGFHPR